MQWSVLAHHFLYPSCPFLHFCCGHFIYFNHFIPLQCDVVLCIWAVSVIKWLLLLGRGIFKKCVCHQCCIHQVWTSDEKCWNIPLQTPVPLKEKCPWRPGEHSALFTRSHVCARDPQQSDQAQHFLLLQRGRSSEPPGQHRGGEPAYSRTAVSHLLQSPLQSAQRTESNYW